jgi:DNA replication protein DnaC
MDCKFGECDGSGFVVDTEARTTRPCRCRPDRIAQAKKRRLDSRIPKRYQGLSFDRAPVIDMSPDVVSEVRRYVTNLDENLARGRGLWLMGDVGTGKTSLAMVVCQAALERGHSVAIYSLPKLLAALRASFRDGAETSYVDMIDALAAVDLLHIDDVGAAKETEWVLEQLYSIVNSRYEEEKAISITTNLSPEQLEEQITERTVSRLVEMCGTPLPLFGADERKQVRIPEHLRGPLRYGELPS